MGLVQFWIKLCTAKPWESDFDPPEKVNNVRETIWAGDGMYKCVKGAR